MHDTNRIRNQIDSENETTLQIPLRGNAPGSRPLPMYASSPADTTAVTAKAPLPLPATGYEGRLLRSEFMSYTIRQTPRTTTGRPNGTISR